MAENGGPRFYTTIQIQNASTTAVSANVVLTFAANCGVANGCPNSNTPNPETFTLLQGQSKTLFQAGGISSLSPNNNWLTFGKYVGSATITQNGTSANLVAIVNQQNYASPNTGSAYEGFDPNAASATVNLPLVAANNSGFNTSINLVAVSGSGTATVDYSTNSQSGALAEPVSDSKALSAGQSWVLIQAGAPGVWSGLNNWSTAGRYVGSAKVTTTGTLKVFVIVNFQNPSATGDKYYTYDGFNQ